MCYNVGCKLHPVSHLIVFLSQANSNYVVFKILYYCFVHHEMSDI